jgi:large subunit ribosomal protein L5e
VLCQALSSELKRYGVEAGLTNYAASYATGLLCSRRLLGELGL